MIPSQISLIHSVKSLWLESGDPSAHSGSTNKGMILPFQPLAMTFHNVNYYVDMPKV